jgi:anti-sigma factor RsiW
MTTQDDMREDLQAYLDGELSAERSAEVRASLDRDPHLREIAEELEAVDRLLERHPQAAVSGDFADRVRDALHAGPGRAWWRRPWAGGLAAASVLVAAVAIWNPFASDVSVLGTTPPDDFSVLEVGPEGQLEQLVTDIEWISEEFLPLD